MCILLSLEKRFIPIWWLRRAAGNRQVITDRRNLKLLVGWLQEISLDMWTEQEIKLKETVHSTSFVIHKFVQLQLTVYSHSKIFSGRHRKNTGSINPELSNYNVSHKCHNMTRDENLQSCQGCTWGHWRAPSHDIVCTKLKVRKFEWLATRVCRSVISIQYRPQALQHLHKCKFCADFHAKNLYVNVYMSPCRPFTCKFECISKVTDFGCKNTCKLLISLQQQMWLMKN